MDTAAEAEAGARAPWQPGPGAAMLAVELHALGIDSRMVCIPSERGCSVGPASAGLAAVLESMCMAYGIPGEQVMLLPVVCARSLCIQNTRPRLNMRTVVGYEGTKCASNGS